MPGFSGISEQMAWSRVQAQSVHKPAFATFNRFAASRICTGMLVNGKEKPLQLSIEGEDTVGLLFKPGAGRGPFLGERHVRPWPVKSSPRRASEDRNTWFRKVEFHG